ncbi:nucleotidyl transferase AbiEii/AbiGii toxin family protein [Algoriphagus aquimarinus]|uniref:Predicted nucleotidyltransferase component of viral defense system n=1 Tax=Algoriphagus aquimarinus TaxID=237018 RepID=A0A1I1BPM0_9BACT|nr:nucleotidyl transferase AbiEii/AbiGii toxin family protein [Algoriphagus aquimarinus]SFB50698.1 Predicted nucleotidyltransferase component of viral defense system [Algoriphagus aquimarinus]
MNLHENPELFMEAVRATAQRMGILDIYVEKDYWVTRALHLIFSDSIGSEVVFKGGTALSKCYGLIERFSEDIDLVVLKRAGESGNQLKKKLKAISSVVEGTMPEVEIKGITNKLGMIRKTAHEYPVLFSGKFGQVRDKVILESSSLGHYEPYHKQEINSYIYEMMMGAGQSALVEEYQLKPFTVQVLDIRRTLCEKILSLVRFSHSENPIADLKMKIRHLYDLHRILEQEDFRAFILSSDFEEMLNRVGGDDVEGYRSNNAWLNYHPKEALIFADVEGVWKELETTYSRDFSGLVYGDLPSVEEILSSLKFLAERIDGIIWEVRVD